MSNVHTIQEYDVEMATGERPPPPQPSPSQTAAFDWKQQHWTAYNIDGVIMRIPLVDILRPNCFAFFVRCVLVVFAPFLLVKPIFSDLQKQAYLRALKSATTFVTILCICIYILSVGLGMAPISVNSFLSPSYAIMGKFGAVDRSHPLQIWRWFTCSFLHYSIMHLMFNMYALFRMIGMRCERRWGFLKWMLVFVATSMTSGAIAAAEMSFSSSTQMAGASGVICGIVGGWVAELVILFPLTTDRNTLMEMYGDVVYVVVYVFMLIWASFLPEVSWSGHLGGFSGGLCIGCWLYGFQIPERKKRITVLSISGSFYIFLLSVGLISVIVFQS